MLFNKKSKHTSYRGLTGAAYGARGALDITQVLPTHNIYQCAATANRNTVRLAMQ